MTTPPAHIDAATAADRLQVSRATLYSYVSRGFVRSCPHPDDPRARLYSAADIDNLVVRKTRQRKPADAAAGALDWGLPALDTRISQISGGRLSYRSIDVVELADRATFEETAELLWESPALSAARFDAATRPRWRSTAQVLAAADPLTRALNLLPILLPEEVPGLPPARFVERGGVLVRAVAQAVVPGVAADAPLHEAFAKAWKAPGAADAIRRALVLIADHEMNASTFAVRVVASTGATLTASLLAGLAALSGPRHGGAIARVGAFFDEVERRGDAIAALRERMARGEPAPGFGHTLYPEGDPRAEALLSRSRNPQVRNIVEAVETETGLKPSIDVALYALEKEHTLPAGAGLALFTAGRSAGWVAHALEQRQTGKLIRPRARFTAGEELL